MMIPDAGRPLKTADEVGKCRTLSAAGQCFTALAPETTKSSHPRMPFEIKVSNAWVNRIVGDRQPNTTKTYTFTSPKYYKADSKLVPSGLLGPVQIVQSTAEAPAK